MRQDPSSASTLRTALAAWVVLFASVSALTIVALFNFKAVYLADRTTGLSLGLLLSAVGPATVILAALAAVSGLAAVVLEMRHRAFDRIVRESGLGAALLLLSAATLWFAHAILEPGLPVTGDASAHISRINHLALALRDGSSLYWDNYAYAGATLLQFTGPVFHWAATALTLGLGDAADAAKLLVAVLRLCGAVAAFALFRQLGIGRAGAFVGALAYAGSFAFTYLVSYRSSFPQALNLALFPLMLLCADKVLRGQRTLAWGALLCLVATLLIGNHQPTAAMAAIYAALFLLFRRWQLGIDLRRFALFGAIGAAIALCSVYFWLPFIVEGPWTAEAPATRLLGLTLPGPATIGNLLRWTRSGGGAGADYSAYLGLAAIALAIAGGAAILARPAPAGATAPLWAFAVAMAVFSVFLVGAYVRPIVFTLLFTAMAAAAGAERLAAWIPGRPVLVLVALVFADLGLGAIQPWNRSDLRSLPAIGDRLAAEAGGQRVVEIAVRGESITADIGPGSTPLQYGRLQSLSGPHKMDATKAHNPVAAIVKMVEADLRAGGFLSAPTTAALQLLNVGWIVGTEGVRLGLPAGIAANARSDALGRHIRVPQATPVVASGRLAEAAAAPGIAAGPFWNDDFEAKRPDTQAMTEHVRSQVTAMALRAAERTADRLFVPTLPSGPPWPAPADRPPAIQLTAYAVEPGRVRVAVRTDRAGYLRLAHPAYPAIHVSRNGAPVAHLADSLNFIVVPLQAGENAYLLEASPSALRKATFAATMAGFGLTVVACLVGLARGRRQRPGPDAAR